MMFANLPVLGLDFEVGLRMLADRAALGGLVEFEDRAAVAALPEQLAVLGEDGAVLDVLG